MRLRVLAVVVALGSSVLSASPAEAAAAARPYDFNGDSYPELVVGAPGLRVGSVARAGGVVVLPASARGLSMREKVISQSSRGVPGASEEGDGFGSAVASADFDRDGYADLAVGHLLESVEGAYERGAVTVIYGSSRGLNTSRSVRINPTPDTIPEIRGPFFGYALVAGDFNRDGFPDLAVGAPSADLEGQVGGSPSGSVTVILGGRSGLSATDPVVLRGQGGGLSDSNFGSGLAAGDVDQDGGTDLIVHAPSGETDTNPDDMPASISYCPGWVDRPIGCTRLLQDRAYAFNFQVSLAVGNMSGDARPEIIVGLPYNEYDQLTARDWAGEVRILSLGAGTPLTVDREARLTQDSRGVPGTQESFIDYPDGSFDPGDRFGFSVALGHIDRDGYADLVIGAPGENRSEGRVTVVHGAASGWRRSGNYFYSQKTRGIPGVAERGDLFGSDLSLRDHNRDGRLDLTVGAGGENDSGAITTLGGSGGGFTTTGARTFGLANLGYFRPASAGFGATLGE